MLINHTAAVEHATQFVIRDLDEALRFLSRHVRNGYTASMHTARDLNGDAHFVIETDASPIHIDMDASAENVDIEW